MIRWAGKKITANEYAKRLVLTLGEQAYYWLESHEDEYDLMTEKEKDSVHRLVDKHWRRVRRLLLGDQPI